MHMSIYQSNKEKAQDIALPSGLAIRNGDDADSRDGEEVEGSRADDGARAQRLRLEPVPHDAHDGQQDLRCRRTCKQSVLFFFTC